MVLEDESSSHKADSIHTDHESNNVVCNTGDRTFDVQQHKSCAKYMLSSMGMPLAVPFDRRHTEAESE